VLSIRRRRQIDHEPTRLVIRFLGVKPRPLRRRQRKRHLGCLAGNSQLGELDPATGAVRRAAPLPSGYFGEGITVVGGRIWQLTYRDGVAIEWNKLSLTPVREVPFSGEGWGLCRDGDRLIRSDGTDRLHFHGLHDVPAAPAWALRLSPPLSKLTMARLRYTASQAAQRSQSACQAHGRFWCCLRDRADLTLESSPHQSNT
jgi:Glutamine cyclotransferase